VSIFLYILSTLAANYTADIFIDVVPGISFAIGTLFFGATFTLRDYMHRHGRKTVYLAIVLALACNAVMSVWLGVDWRIIGASFLSIAIAESTDTEIYQALIQKSWLVRVTGSNLVSIPLDTVLFTVLAFGGVLPWPLIWSIIVGDTIVKFIIATLIALPRTQFQPQQA
jgi:hypothetical protein